MSGEFGKIFKRSWGDRDFKSLTEGEQALYHKLVSQPEVSLAGVLTYAPQRWAGQTAGLTVDDIEQRFAGLLLKRYLLWDSDTQEVLIRSYIRNDLGWRSPRTVIGINLAVRRVLSESLQNAIAAELTRLELSEVSEEISKRTGRSSRDVVEPLIRDLIDDFLLPEGVSGHAERAPDTVSDGVSHTVSHGVSHTVSAFRLRQEQTQTQEQPQEQEQTQEHLSPSAPSAAAAPRESDNEELLIVEEPESPDPFEEWWGAYGIKIDRKKAEAKYRQIIKKREASPALLLDTAKRYVDNQKAIGKFPEYSKRPLTWLNGACWNDELPTPAGDDDGWYNPPPPPAWVLDPEGTPDHG